MPSNPRDQKRQPLRKDDVGWVSYGDFDARAGFHYLRKWVVVSIATGIVAGLGALVLIQGIDFFTKLFLVGIVGYVTPASGWRVTNSSDHHYHRSTLANTSFRQVWGYW